MDRVLVTGAAGFLGSHTAEMLAAKGYDVLGVDSFVTGTEANIPSRIAFETLDLNDLAATKAMTSKFRPSHIFHAAATPYDGLSVFSPGFVTQNNYLNTVNLISAAVDTGSLRRFVFCSSMARYGAQGKLPFSEEMAPKPTTPYGIAKLSAELALEQLSTLHGFEYSVLIPHNVYGPRQIYDDPFRNVVAIFMNRLLQDKELIVYGDGEQKRCFTYIDDVLPIIEKMIFSDEARSQKVNVGPNDEFISLNALAERIEALAGHTGTRTYLESRPGEVRLANCSHHKASKLFGYHPQVDLDDGLRRMWAWMKHSGPKPFRYNHIELEIRTASTPKTWVEPVM